MGLNSLLAFSPGVLEIKIRLYGFLSSFDESRPCG